MEYWCQEWLLKLNPSPSSKCKVMHVGDRVQTGHRRGSNKEDYKTYVRAHTEYAVQSWSPYMVRDIQLGAAASNQECQRFEEQDLRAD